MTIPADYPKALTVRELLKRQYRYQQTQQMVTPDGRIYLRHTYVHPQCDQPIHRIQMTNRYVQTAEPIGT